MISAFFRAIYYLRDSLVSVFNFLTQLVLNGLLAVWEVLSASLIALIVHVQNFVFSALESVVLAFLDWISDLIDLTPELPSYMSSGVPGEVYYLANIYLPVTELLVIGSGVVAATAAVWSLRFVIKLIPTIG